MVDSGQKQAAIPGKAAGWSANSPAGYSTVICPQCHGRIPAGTLWSLSGLAHLACPRCHACLCPTAACAILLFGLSVGLGDAALALLLRHGGQLGLGMSGFFVAFACAYGLAAPFVLRLRVRNDDGRAGLGRRSSRPTQLSGR